MSDILAVGLLVTVLAGGLTLLRLPSENGGFHWFVAWVSLGLAGGLRLMTPEVPLLEHLLPPLGTQFGALILAGAFLFAGRPLPRWLLPAAAVLMGARALAHAAGQVELAIALGEVAETPAVLAAAWLVWQAGARTGPLVPTRMLGTLLVAVAVADTVQHVGAIAVGPHWSGGLLLWLLVAPPALGAHYLALTRRTADALSRSHEELEQRFALRTTELRDTVARLEREVVERVAAEEALRRSEERFRQISELASDLAFCVRISPGGELSLDWLWGAFERITGYPPDALDGHGWLSLLDADTQRGMAGELARAPQAGARSTERKIVRRDGEERWLQLRFQSVRTDSDGTLEVMGSGSDVTDRVHAETEQRRLEAHMQRAQRAESLGILAGGVAHDFNNLLTVIRGNVRLALEDEAPDSPAREKLERVRTAAEHAASLTEQMLAYAGKSTAELEPVDLGGLAEGMMGLLLASVSDRCTLETELRAELPLVEADAGQLRQVILNLVINASESLGDEPGRVTVRTGVRRLDAAELAGCVGATGAEPGEYVLLEVADTGCGMDPDTQGRVFEPFFTTKFSGRGLGMAALLGIVQAHRGVVSFDSRPGEGTRVQVLLPPSSRGVVAKREAPVVPATPEGAASGTVLVVDDDEAVLELNCELLELAGFRTLAARGGRDAIELLRQQREAIDAVVLDLAMPDLDGEQTFLEMREVRDDVPVVLVTGYDDEYASRRFAAHGLDDFLRKPYDPDELVARVRSVLP